MKRYLKHLGSAKHLGELRFKSWSDKNVSPFLADVGVIKGSRFWILAAVLADTRFQPQSGWVKVGGFMPRTQAGWV